MSDADFDARQESYQDGYECGLTGGRDEVLERLGLVLSRLESVRQILRLIARQSRDEYASEQAEEALRLLEVHDVR
jgi:hypothetical protein